MQRCTLFRDYVKASVNYLLFVALIAFINLIFHNFELPVIQNYRQVRNWLLTSRLLFLNRCPIKILTNKWVYKIALEDLMYTSSFPTYRIQTRPIVE